MFFFYHSAVFTAEVYKYKDDNRKWVFSDRKPHATKEVEKAEYKGSKKVPPEPRIHTKKSNGLYSLVFHNPYLAPIEVEMLSSLFESGSDKEIVAVTLLVGLSQTVNS